MSMTAIVNMLAIGVLGVIALVLLKRTLELKAEAKYLRMLADRRGKVLTKMFTHLSAGIKELGDHDPKSADIMNDRLDKAAADIDRTA